MAQETKVSLEHNEAIEQSNVLSVLDTLGVEYIQKGKYAQLVDHDSLSIQLNGKYKDSWMRWSTGDHGNGATELVQYLIQIGSLDPKLLKGVNLKSVKKVKVKEPEPFNYKTMVTNPNPMRAKHFLVNTRKLSSVIVDRMFELGKIVQDGRDNIRFMWESGPGNFTGADVQGTRYDKQFERGYLKHAVAGSKGLFFIQDINLSSIKDVKNIYIFEAPIDLLSYVEMASYTNESRLEIPEVLPNLKEGWMAVSLSGADSKIMPALQKLQQDFKINLKNVKFFVATDNDDHGEQVYARLLEDGYNVERVLPNNGTPHILNDNLPVKDWNDLLKIIKS